MEKLTEKVYECTLAVEAHMIVDLLARAGIAARADGEFLAGAGGELPLGSTIKVRVEPARAAEAREVIDEWEKIQPPEPTPEIKRPRGRSLLWFFVGGACGFAAALVVMRSPATEDGFDYDGDGRNEVTYHYSGNYPVLTEIDRNRDGRVDDRWRYGLSGVPKTYENDDDFDGYFEWQYQLEDRLASSGTRDSNADGKPDEFAHFIHGVLDTLEIDDEAGDRLVARQHYVAGSLAWIELDRDGDGQFDRVELDRYGIPR